jgi:putative Ig domain-containing protein/glucodextranase-like protein
MQLVPSLRWLIFVFVAVVVGSADTVCAQSVTVAWDPSADPAAIGYMVYAGTQSGQYTKTFDVGTATSFVYGVVPEQTYFFAVASYAVGGVVGPLSSEVSASASAVVLADPGNQTSVVGQPTSLQLHATDSSGGALTFGASGLPEGLAINTGSGLIFGTPVTRGIYPVVAFASNGAMTSSLTFTWTVISSSSSTDVTVPVVQITMPTSSGYMTSADSSVTIGGVSQDDVGVVAVNWMNERGEGGQATGTATWLANVPLHSGRNRITVMAVDAAGNSGTATLVIRHSPGQ